MGGWVGGVGLLLSRKRRLGINQLLEVRSDQSVLTQVFSL
jgi:hypothetical protein